MPIKKQETKRQVKITSESLRRAKRHGNLTKKDSIAKTLSVTVYSLAGSVSGTMSLPEEIFGMKVNKKLLTQAMRVYLNNLKGHRSHTKTRGEVEGSTRKIYAQKGTGRARHGGIRAPIFVGGGISLGPKNRKTVLELSKKMKRASLISALTEKLSERQILGLSGLDKSNGKTSEMTALFKKIEKKSALVLGDKNMNNAQRALRNIPGLSFLSVDQVNAYEVIKHQSLILTKEAVDKLQERLTKDVHSDKSKKTKTKKGSKNA